MRLATFLVETVRYVNFSRWESTLLGEVCQAVIFDLRLKEKIHIEDGYAILPEDSGRGIAPLLGFY